jgi:hypothetical protein
MSRRWHIAIREKNRSKEYHIIKNPSWGWAADPFLFDNGGRTYLFAELWEYKKNRGCLGYIEIKDGIEVGDWKRVISEEYHLSYPNIFRKGNDIVICPESGHSNTTYFYIARSFPDKWEKQEPFIDNMDCVDTTFVEKDHRLFGVTCLYHEKPMKLLLFMLNNDKAEFSKENPISTNPSMARPGGNFFFENESIIRVCQDCSRTYGEALVFTKVDLQWPSFKESEIRRITINDITIDKKMNVEGIHTYNKNDMYEVIDLKCTEFNLENIIWRIIRKIKKF